MSTAPDLVDLPPDLVHTDITPLEDGWSPTTPDGDNVVLDAVRAMAHGFAAWHGGAGDRVVVADGMTMTDSGAPTPFGNVTYLTGPIHAADAFAAALRSFYAGTAGGPYLVFSPWPTGDLRPFGLAPVGHPPLMVRWSPVDPAPTDLRISQVTTERALRDFERTLVEAYPVRELWPWAPGALASPGVLGTAWRLFVGSVDGVPVATAAGFVSPTATLVEMVSTRPEVRGRGYGAALTDAAASAAGDDRPAVLIASDDGQGVYAGLGFRRISRFTLWLGTR
jgi:GNAT superfamily N-acetyltransferase